MTNFSQLDPQRKRKTEVWIGERSRQLDKLVMGYYDHCARYLFITNAGGILSIIAYMGQAGVDKANFCHKSALVLFVLGVIFSGIVNFMLLHRADLLVDGWKKDSRDFYDDKIPDNDLWARDDARFGSNKKYYCVGYASFGSFILGAITGLFAFLVIWDGCH